MFIIASYIHFIQPKWNFKWDGIQEDTTNWPEYHDLLLLRHGEYFHNIPLHGLSSEGMVQAEATGQYIHNCMQAGDLRIGCILHSEMQRAVETARIIYSKLQPLQPSLTLGSSKLLNEGLIKDRPWINEDVRKHTCTTLNHDNHQSFPMYRLIGEGLVMLLKLLLKGRTIVDQHSS